MRKSTADRDVAQVMTLLDLARRGNRDAFQRLAEPYRRELHLHCYRMLGSLQDAEDLVQETFLRAWRGIEGFDGRASLRSWLYRIATNASLNALARRASTRRALPKTQVPPTDEMPEGAPPSENIWLEPYPDALLEGIADTAPGPEAHYELHEAIQLAFVAAIQHLPPRQRAVLLLRDVLGWPAADTAGLLDTSVASANSALQRARATLEKEFPSGQPTALPEPDDQQRMLLDRYVRAWEDANIDELVALLRDDATFSMPPWSNWYRGHEAIRTFLRWLWASDAYGSSRTEHSSRLIPTIANGQPAFAAYRRDPETSELHAHAIHLPIVEDNAIASITCFVVPLGPQLFAAFGLPDILPAEETAPQELRT